MKQTFYHGSPTKGIKILEPRLDERLNMKGIFIADEPFTPMMFALLPKRADCTVNSTTKEGKFVRGEVKTPRPLNTKGYLYSIEIEEKEVTERKPGRYMLIHPTKVKKCQTVRKKEVLALGWKVTLMKNQNIFKEKKIKTEKR